MNSDLKFDPQTGQPIQNSNLKFDPQTGQPIQTAELTPQPVAPAPVELAPQPVQPNDAASLTQINAVPTVEQSESDFLNNAQAVSQEKVETKKTGGINYAFVIILFIIVLLAIFFLFPYLAKRI